MPKAPASGSRPVRELGRRSLALPLPGHAASRLGRDLASAPCAWPQSSAPGRCRKATAVGQIVRCNGTAADGRVKYLGVVQLVDPLLTFGLAGSSRRGAAESSHSTFDMSSVPERAPSPLNRGGIRPYHNCPRRAKSKPGTKSEMNIFGCTSSGKDFPFHVRTGVPSANNVAQPPRKAPTAPRALLAEIGKSGSSLPTKKSTPEAASETRTRIANDHQTARQSSAVASDACCLAEAAQPGEGYVPSWWRALRSGASRFTAMLCETARRMNARLLSSNTTSERHGVA